MSFRVVQCIFVSSNHTLKNRIMMHYYYFDVGGRRYTFLHLSEAIQEAKKQTAPIDIYNSEGVLMYSLTIHEF